MELIRTGCPPNTNISPHDSVNSERGYLLQLNFVCPLHFIIHGRSRTKNHDPMRRTDRPGSVTHPWSRTAS